MATNFYFNNFKSSQEQTLVEDLIIESIKIYGHDVFYLPRTVVENDPIFKEDDISKYESAYSIEMYIKNVDGFQGEGDFLSKFGLQIRDQITFTISRRVYEDNIYYNGLSDSVRPLEGDLIYFPLNQKLFQIKFVEHEAIFYQMGSLQTYDLVCELWEQSDEELNTGIKEIDMIEEDYSQSQTIYLTGVNSDFTLNEIVRQQLPLDENYYRTATASASITNGLVSGFTISEPGYGYTTAPTVTISAPLTTNATATLEVSNTTFQVTSVNVSNGGGWYTTTPVVTLDPPLSTPVTATANATLVGDSVLSIAVDEPGTHYTTSPSVTISDPPPTAIRKFGNGSLNHSSSTDNTALSILSSSVSVSDSQGYRLSIWFYPTGAASENQILFYGTNFLLYRSTDNTINVQILGGAAGTSTGTVIANQWNFIQVEQVDFNVYVHVNSDVGSLHVVSTGQVFVSGETLYAGDNGQEGFSSFIGYIDDLIIDNITSIDTSSYSVPVSANSGGNVLTKSFDFTTATADAVVSEGSVTEIIITDGGDGYIEPPVITIEPSTGNANNFIATATATVDANTGEVSSVNVTSGGQYYTGAEGVTIDSPLESTANASATIVNGTLTSISVVNPGLGYTNAPTVTLTVPLVPYITGEVISVLPDADNANAYYVEMINIKSDNINYNNFINNQEVIGLSSNTSGTVSSTTSEDQPSTTQNDDFKNETTGFLDFSELDPFSEEGSY